MNLRRNNTYTLNKDKRAATEGVYFSEKSQKYVVRVRFKGQFRTVSQHSDESVANKVYEENRNSK